MIRGARRTLSRIPEPVRFAGSLVLASVLLSLVAYFAVRAQPNQGFVPIWPEGGLGLALMWRYGAKYWPAVAVSNTTLSYTVGTPLLAATGVGWLQVLVTGTALYLLKRWEVRQTLDDLRQFGLFTFACAIGCSLAFPVYGFRVGVVLHYPTALALEYGMDYFLSALFSCLIFTPLLVANWRRIVASPLRRSGVAVALLAIGMAGVIIASLPDELKDRTLFLLLPLVMLASVSGQMPGASAAMRCFTSTDRKSTRLNSSHG